MFEMVFGMIGMDLRQMRHLFWEMGEGGDEFEIVGTFATWFLE